MGYTALDRGCEIAISRLSEISGVSVAALAANASHRVDEWLHLRGQIIAPRSRRAKPISLESAIVRWFVGSGGPAAMNPACMVRPVIPKPRAAPGGLMSLATFGANFSLAAALMSSAWAQSATVERSAKGAAATNIQVGLYLNVKPDCTSGTLPAIRLLAPPANGTLTIKRGKVTATNYKQCLALEAPRLRRLLQIETRFRRRRQRDHLGQGSGGPHRNPAHQRHRRQRQRRAEDLKAFPLLMEIKRGSVI